MSMDEFYVQLGLRGAAQRAGIAPLDDPSGDGAAPEFARRLERVLAAAGELNLDQDAIHLAVEIAALEPALDYARRFALTALVVASLAALQEGSTRLPVSGTQAAAPLRRLLQPLAAAALGEGHTDELIGQIAALAEARLAPHVIGGARDDYRPLIYLKPFLYQQRMLIAETAAARLIAGRLALSDPGPEMTPSIEAALADIEQRPTSLGGRRVTLSDEQRAAVRRAAAQRLNLISGGPGTGKTSVVVAILRVLGRIGLRPDEIALAAPTGKAAYRLGDSIREGLANIEAPTAIDQMLHRDCPEPQTIHRLLGYSPGRRRFRHHRANPISAAAVVVDETSMLDLALTERLLAAVPDTTRLILLGDAGQLPSVAAGAVFRDLVAADTVPALARGRSLLTYNYRIQSQAPGAELLTLAQGIARGEVAPGAEAADAARGTAPQMGLPFTARLYRMRASVEELSFAGAEFLGGEVDLEDFLERWFTRHARPREVDDLVGETLVEHAGGFDEAGTRRLQRLFDLTAVARILCVTRVFPFGAERVNAALHRRAQGDSVWSAWMPGEPVMIVRNDYERMLFNGDQGVLLRVRSGEGSVALMAVFRRREGFAAFHLEALRSSLELCYATTVHKAQGSEFDSVALLLPDRMLPILTREIVYTAVTRARRSVLMVGSEEILARAVERRMDRFTGLSDEIMAQMRVADEK